MGLRLIIAAFAGLLGAGAASAEPLHALAMHGEPALGVDFAHLPYADPGAPKGGRLTLAWAGSFDSLNPFIVRGVFPPGLANVGTAQPSLVFETLMARSHDEPFTLYGLLAESADMSEARDEVTFTLREEARFSDGRPVTVEDVIFSLEILREKGRPNHRSYYGKVARAERTGERGVRFVLDSAGDRELPLILALMPILPAHAVDTETFDQTTMRPPLGSGPYEVAEVRPGASITYRRDRDYWGADLAFNSGLWNFDEIRYEFFRDDNGMWEAFKSGLVDMRAESDAGRWTSGYDFPAAVRGDVVRDAFETGTPKGMSGFVFNTRKPVFSDARVRRALALLYDFEWTNRTLYHGAFQRTQSYFQGSELASTGIAQGPTETALLAPFPNAVRADVRDGTYRAPATDGSGRDRGNIRESLRLLEEAGYRVEGGRTRHEGTGAPLAFEILVQTREQERLALTYSRMLARAGIAASVRNVDTAQFQQRQKTFDFDMLEFFWPSSLSPGNELNFRWSSAAAQAEGSFNLPGVSEPAVDALIGEILSAEAREDFVVAVRALDRVLISGDYVLPLHHRPQQWVARWRHIERPARTPLAGYAPETWWRAP